ncbi:hypothetical protein CGZ75_08325 [Paenibacillus herberti]|uniref:Uncharacterized protein n=1 Tax=Paenibacillus herberti TaxID=1619309 RepID=A0A229P3M0_9BACL|nr:hypothetical protein CGZ75_08325 [Paenibacillus herberti]
MLIFAIILNIFALTVVVHKIIHSIHNKSNVVETLFLFFSSGNVSFMIGLFEKSLRLFFMSINVVLLLVYLLILIKKKKE